MTITFKRNGDNKKNLGSLKLALSVHGKLNSVLSRWSCIIRGNGVVSSNGATYILKDECNLPKMFKVCQIRIIFTLKYIISFQGTLKVFTSCLGVFYEIWGTWCMFSS